MAQLSLGDPPDLLKTKAHPVARLLWQHSKRQQADILYLAKAIGGEKNVNKSLRRIKEIFSGERLHPFWIKHLSMRVAAAMEVMTTEVEVVPQNGASSLLKLLLV
ncbi:MAG: hypothetical protein QE267_09455 [Akkermansiaceae bacterium]|nr:hypothetical protein [Akkermansiaceae bacterium]